jgi:molecular chaperone GrpE
MMRILPTERKMTMNEEENMNETSEEELEKTREETDIDVDISEQDNKLSEENEKLQKEIADANDKYIRLCAEYDNYRKRTTREKTEAYGDATAKCIQDIIPVLDSFERAMEAETTDSSFKDGMKMIYDQFVQALEKIGVTEMEALGQEFDPNIHNAIKQEESDEYGENTVCQVFQKGYMLGDRVIRHAVVAVTA